MNLTMMVYLTLMNICITIFILIIMVYFLRKSNKSLKHIFNEIKYELMFNALGAKAVLDNYIIREKDQNEYLGETEKNVIITGGARGIGAEVVKKLLKCHFHVIIGCRKIEAGENLIKNVRQLGIKAGTTEVLELDVSSLESVKLFADKINEKYSKIHILINNAGKMFGPYFESSDGYESQFATNYLGHFFLTHLLLPKLIAAGEVNCNARIINISSCAHLLGSINFEDINMKKAYVSKAAYAQSKLAQILFAIYLNDKMKEQNLPVSVYSVHPGVVNTDLFNNTYLKTAFGSYLCNMLFKTPEKGATSTIYACLSRKLEYFSGTYISNCQITPTSKVADCKDLQKQFFEFTNNLLNISVYGKIIKIT